MSVTPVPGKAAFYAAAVYWMGNAGVWSAAQGIGSYASSTYIQYDGESCDFTLKDYTGDAATWDPYILRAYQEYNYYVNTIATPPGGIAAFLGHTDGFLKDVLRGTSRAAAAKASIQAIIDNGAYNAGTGGDPMHLQEYSREVAYVLIHMLNGALAGCTISAAKLTWRAQLFNYMLGHFDAWVNGSASYCRPFMFALSAKTAIKYYQQISADARIPAKIALVADYIRSSCWKASAGSWGDGQSFLYTDRFVVDSDDLKTAPDLNMLIAPVFGWLYSVTGQSKYRTWGDECFQGGTPVYAGPVRVSGADMGTPAAPQLKRVHQQYYWGFDYITYAETDVGGITVPSFPLAKPIKEARVKDNSVQDVLLALVAATPSTIYTPAADAYAILVGIQYADGEAHTLSFISGSTTLASFEFAANSGLSKEISKNPIFIGRLGEAIKLQSSSNVAAVLCYVMEVKRIPMMD